jgi:hypothetical protein
VSQGVRLYQFTTPSDPQGRDACAQLLALASQRAGRVRLTKYLRGGAYTAQAELPATRHILDAAQRRVLASNQKLPATQRIPDAALQLVQASWRQLNPGSERPPS